MAITTKTTSVRVASVMPDVAAETCPLCGTDDVRVEDVAWFAIEFERRSDVQDELDVPDAVVFLCRECGVNWD
ncbi:hypothetical protein IT882_10925 [Microbacterium schleiferi]|uniref:Uncharacterized protein n=1 Tax=Microbacterium schleiferi TaxID=69362 RepID=A0A7S8MVA7_9MICO|nr:hypothetical protein [Microbacterium schleiferi]QPE03789.1 hypothetical protein IT882_10925 [Microbacterium schleiferi]